MATEPGKTSIFLSYSHQFHKETVQRLADFLIFQKSHQWNIVIDPASFENAIDSASLVVVCYSSKYPDHKTKEIEYADRRRKTIFIVDLHETKPTIDGALAEILAKACDSFDFYEFEQFEYAAQEVVRRISKALLATRFRIFNAPDGPHRPWPRSILLYNTVAKTLRKICLSPGAGVLLISGADGVGKTSFISAFFQNSAIQEKLVEKLNVKTVVWVNCHKWRNEPAFLNNDLVAIAKTVKNELSNGLRKFGRQKDADLFIFDDVSQTGLIEVLCNLARAEKIRFCAIASSYAIKADPKLCQIFERTELQIVQIPVLSDEETVGLIRNLLLAIPGIANLVNIVVGQNLLRDAAHRCYGLPRNAVKFADMFRSLNSNSTKTEIEKVINTFLKNANFCETPRIQEKHSEKKSINDPNCLTLILRNVPTFDDYLQRTENETKILLGIKALNKPHALKNCFLVTGRSGIGKSSLISATLRNPEYNSQLVGKAKIDIVVWLNCQPKTAAYADETARELLKLAALEAPPNESSKWNSLSDAVAYFDKKVKQHVLFVLDGISMSTFLALRKQCGNGLFLAIIGEDEPPATTNVSHLTRNCFEVGPMADNQLVEMFEGKFDMKDKLQTSQIQQIILRFCRGSPLVTSQFAGQFYRCRNYQNRFESILADKLLPFCKTERDMVSLLFRRSFAMLTWQMRKYFLSLILFEIDEPIQMAQLAALWSRSIDDAMEFVEMFEDLALVRRSCHDHTPTCHITRVIFVEAVMQKASEKLKFISLPDLRLQVASTISPGCDFLDFCYVMVEKEQFDLLCDIICKIPANFSHGRPEVMTFPTNLRDSQGRTALIASAKSGHFHLTALLYEKCPIAITLEDNQGRTAFAWAVQNGNIEVASFLLEKWPSAFMFCDVHGRNLVISAIELKQDVKVLEFLLQKRPDFLSDNPNLLFHAVHHGNIQIVEFVYSKSPQSIRNVNIDGKIALMVAAESGQLGVVRFLHEHWRSSVEEVDNNGENALMLASRGDNLEIVRYLYEVWPDGAQVRSKTGLAALRLARDVDVSKFLYERWYEYTRMAEKQSAEEERTKRYAEMTKPKHRLTTMF